MSLYNRNLVQPEVKTTQYFLIIFTQVTPSGDFLRLLRGNFPHPQEMASSVFIHLVLIGSSWCTYRTLVLRHQDDRDLMYACQEYDVVALFLSPFMTASGKGLVVLLSHQNLARRYLCQLGGIFHVFHGI